MHTSHQVTCRHYNSHNQGGEAVAKVNSAAADEAPKINGNSAAGNPEAVAKTNGAVENKEEAEKDKAETIPRANDDVGFVSTEIDEPTITRYSDNAKRNRDDIAASGVECQCGCNKHRRHRRGRYIDQRQGPMMVPAEMVYQVNRQPVEYNAKQMQPYVQKEIRREKTSELLKILRKDLKERSKETKPSSYVKVISPPVNVSIGGRLVSQDEKQPEEQPEKADKQPEKTDSVALCHAAEQPPCCDAPPQSCQCENAIAAAPDCNCLPQCCQGALEAYPQVTGASNAWCGYYYNPPPVPESVFPQAYTQYADTARQPSPPRQKSTSKKPSSKRRRLDDDSLDFDAFDYEAFDRLLEEVDESVAETTKLLQKRNHI